MKNETKKKYIYIYPRKVSKNEKISERNQKPHENPLLYEEPKT
jgi:hypothetical protein